MSILGCLIYSVCLYRSGPCVIFKQIMIYKALKPNREHSISYIWSQQIGMVRQRTQFVYVSSVIGVNVWPSWGVPNIPTCLLSHVFHVTFQF